MYNKSIALILTFVFVITIYACEIAADKNTNINIEKLKTKVNESVHFLNTNTTFNQDIVFLLDMNLPISSYRFYIYDLNKKTILNKGLVAHGEGSKIENSDSLRFSNVINSNCTSLGKYKIGTSYTGKFGKSYKLHGLDNTNSNAFERYIVLHAYTLMPTNENTFPVFYSLGCPMVSTSFFKQLEYYIDNSDKPILMYIYY